MIEEYSNENIQFLEGSVSVNRECSLMGIKKLLPSLLILGTLKYFISQNFFSFAGKSKQTTRLPTVIDKI
jgi:hypothetical protein